MIQEKQRQLNSLMADLYELDKELYVEHKNLQILQRRRDKGEGITPEHFRKQEEKIARIESSIAQRSTALLHTKDELRNLLNQQQLNLFQQHESRNL
jgi:hypothetical protein